MLFITNKLSKKISENSPLVDIKLDERNIHLLLSGELETTDRHIITIENSSFLQNFVFDEVLHLSVEKKVDLNILTKTFPNLNLLSLFNIGKKISLNGVNNFQKLQRLVVRKCNVEISEEINTPMFLGVDAVDVNEPFYYYFKNIKVLHIHSVKNSQNSDLDELINLNLLCYHWSKNEQEEFDKLGKLINIHGLYFFRASRLTHFPSMSKCSHLKAVSINECHRLIDIKGLSEAPNLEVLCIVYCKSLKPEDFYPLKGHPTLKRVFWGAFPKEQEKVKAYLGDIWDPSLLSSTYVLPDLE